MESRWGVQHGLVIGELDMDPGLYPLASLNVNRLVSHTTAWRTLTISTSRREL